jgi:hypothetical protein
MPAPRRRGEVLLVGVCGWWFLGGRCGLPIWGRDIGGIVRTSDFLFGLHVPLRRLAVSFKIVDKFYGSKDGPDSFLGICDEVRDHRRFESLDDADQAIQDDKEDASFLAASETLRKPLEDQWHRRIMNLTPVPSHYKWCCGPGDVMWEWQEVYAFEFHGPVADDHLLYRVYLNGRFLGRIEKPERPDSLSAWNVLDIDHTYHLLGSAYAAACALLESTKNSP